jgi:hypothetical protein
MLSFSRTTLIDGRGTKTRYNIALKHRASELRHCKFACLERKVTKMGTVHQAQHRDSSTARSFITEMQLHNHYLTEYQQTCQNIRSSKNVRFPLSCTADMRNYITIYYMSTKNYRHFYVTRFFSLLIPLSRTQCRISWMTIPGLDTTVHFTLSWTYWLDLCIYIPTTQALPYQLPYKFQQQLLLTSLTHLQKISYSHYKGTTCKASLNTPVLDTHNNLLIAF